MSVSANHNDRNHPVSEVHHVAVNVSDLERSISFYESALRYRTTVRTVLDGDGMTRAMRIPRGSRARAAILQGASRIGQIELIEWALPREDAPPPPERLTHRPSLRPGVLLLSFEVSRLEIAATYDRMIGLGAICYTEPEEVTIEGYGTISAFLGEDPDGTVLEFVVLPSREELHIPK